jgi:hypothetical protein
MADNIRDFIDSYEIVLARLQAYHTKLRDEIIPKVAELPGRLRLPGLRPEPFQRLYEIEKRIGLFVASGMVVVRLYINGQDWVRVSTTLGSVVGDLRPENRAVPTRWRGQAADVYEQVVVPGQVAAAGQLQAAAQAVAFALHWLAMSVFTFYVALLAFVIELCAILVGAILTAESGVGVVALPGVLAGLAVAIPTMAAQLGALIVTVVECYARARTFFQDMRTKALDMSTFPNGNWPNLDPARYNDATVRDGDPSGWTVVG